MQSSVLILYFDLNNCSVKSAVLPLSVNMTLLAWWSTKANDLPLRILVRTLLTDVHANHDLIHNLSPGLRPKPSWVCIEAD